MVAYPPLATTLQPTADTNKVSDIVVRDMIAKANIVLSDPDGAGPMEANGPSARPTIAVPAFSADPYIAAFETDASNLRGPDTDLNGNTDVYLRLANGTFRLVSHRFGNNLVPENGKSTSPRMSADGRGVLFVSNAEDLIENDGNLLPDLFRYSILTQTVVRISEGVTQEESNDLPLSGDIATDSGGNPITVFDSAATNLTPVADTEQAFDIFYNAADGSLLPVGPVDAVFANGFEGNP